MSGELNLLRREILDLKNFEHIFCAQLEQKVLIDLEEHRKILSTQSLENSLNVDEMKKIACATIGEFMQTEKGEILREVSKMIEAQNQTLVQEGMLREMQKKGFMDQMLSFFEKFKEEMRQEGALCVARELESSQQQKAQNNKFLEELNEK